MRKLRELRAPAAGVIARRQRRAAVGLGVRGSDAPARHAVSVCFRRLGARERNEPAVGTREGNREAVGIEAEGEGFARGKVWGLCWLRCVCLLFAELSDLGVF